MLGIGGRGWTLIVLAVAAGVLTGGPSVAVGADDDDHLVMVPNTAAGRAALSSSSGRVVASYDAFTLVEAGGANVPRLVAAGGDVRDDMRQVRIGARSYDPATQRTSLLDKGGVALNAAGRGGRGLAVVQYVGPLKDSWVAAVEATGVQVVTYMAQNGQLVTGTTSQLKALANLLPQHAFLRAITPYTANDKMPSSLQRAGQTEVVVTTVRGAAGEDSRSALAAVSKQVGSDVPVAGFLQQRVVLNGAELGDIADLGGVVAVEPFVEPRLLDERAAQIVAGNLDPSWQPQLGGGYRKYLLDHGFSKTSTVTIDITDEGVDKGVVPVPAGSHADFYKNGNPAKGSRIVYAQEATAADADARDCGGHGTNVASIATGYNVQTGATYEDAQGFNYGLGIQPFGRLGATKIFTCNGTFDVTTSITALHSAAYGSGARISNNSWGAAVGGAYNSQAQEFDALVRDAQPGVTGNQGFTEVVSAGNSGAGANTIGSPGTAKNVITVGASESVRPIGGTDGCGVTDLGANSARDVIDFSSRGPTDDGRIKPDIVAPGTHVTGAQPQVGADFNGSGTCNPQFPAGSFLYTLVSGTSQAAPEVTGLASLVNSWFHDGVGGGKFPSAAMTKALLVSTATDIAGGDNGAGGSNGPVPTQVQGWGRVNLGTILDGTSRQVVDQSSRLGATGKHNDRYYNVASSSQPLRVTLTWTDAPGPTTGNSFVNDLNLEVIAGGVTYKGNVFAAGHSVAGGSADPANNVENVFLPAGVTGPIKVSVIAANIAGDGVPGNADPSDQDYALVVSNAGPELATPPPILVDNGRTVALTGDDGDGFLEPGESFTVKQNLKNVGGGTATGITGTMSGSKLSVTQPTATWPNLGAGAAAIGAPDFAAKVKGSTACGSQVAVSIQVTTNQGAVPIAFSLPTGAPGSPVTLGSTDVPKAIPDNNPAGVSSTLNIASAGVITDLNVTVGSITHTFDSDLQIFLRSPGGTEVMLVNRAGSAGDNFTNTVLDDEAATPIFSGAAPFSGSFQPFQPLSTFDGESAQGTWTLRVADVAAEDVGTLSSWSTTRTVLECS